MLNINFQINLRKVAVFVVQTAILVLSWYFVYAYSLIGIAGLGVLLHFIKNMRVTGWVSAIAYPVMYWIALLCDTPTELGVLPNNLYVFWNLGYIAVLLIALVADLVIKIKSQ